MATIDTDQELADVTLNIADSHGTPALVDGAPVWSSSDESVLSVTVAADGMSAVVNPIAVGTAHISVSADADMGPGVQTITGVSEDIVVSLGPSFLASVITFNLGTPVSKAPPAPSPPPGP